MNKSLRRPLATAILLSSASYLPAQPQGQASTSTPPAVTGWKIKFEEGGSNPVIVDGVLYLGSADGAVYALDPTTGAIKWRFQTGEDLSPATAGPQVIIVPRDTSTAGQMAAAAQAAATRRAGKRRVDMTPTVANGTVFIGSGDLSFYAIDAATGEQKWSYVAGSGLASNSSSNAAVPAAVLSNGTLYFATENGLHALDPLTGTRKWLLETSQGRLNGVPTAPVMGDGGIFLTAWPPFRQDTMRKSRLFAVDPESGKAKWAISVDGFGISAPLTARGLTFFAVPGTVFGVNQVTGQIKWTFAAERGSETRGLLLADSIVCFGTNEGVFALELETGHQLWSFSVALSEDSAGHPDEITTALQADDQQLYVVTGSTWRPQYTLHALALTTGQEKWSRSGRYIPRVMVHDGIVYADGADKEHLRAIDAATGREMWSFKGTESESARLISGGRLFLTTPTQRYFGVNRVDQGFLYAIDARTGKLTPR